MRWRDNLVRLVTATGMGLYTASKVTAIIAAIVLAAMMLLTTADVFGRYFFSRPVPGTWEVTGLLLVCAGTWGLGYCQAKKGHISVTVLVERFSPRVQAIVRSVAYLIGLAGFSLICWQAWLLTEKYFPLAGSLVTNYLKIPLYPSAFMLVIGTGIAALILFVDLVHSLAGVVRK